MAPYGTKAQFRRHLGRHMEQLALFALPRNDDNGLNEDTDEEIAGDAHSVGSDGSTGTTASEVMPAAAEIEDFGAGSEFTDRELAMLKDQAGYNTTSVDLSRDIVPGGESFTEPLKGNSSHPVYHRSLESMKDPRKHSVGGLGIESFWKCVSFSPLRTAIMLIKSSANARAI